MADKTKKVQQYKVDAVARVKEKVQSCRDFIFTNFRGLNMPQMTELRRQLRETETDFRVVKNNYLRIVLAEMELTEAESMLIDPTALALIRQDSSQVARTLLSFAREAPLKIKGGVIDGRVYSSRDVEEISRLPGREVLLAMLMGTMNAPLTRLVYTLNELNARLVRTLQAVADQKAQS
jgi:large subunit ribosomal protein L10